MTTTSQRTGPESTDIYAASRSHIIAEQNYLLHITLFLLTFLTTTWAGTFWIGHQVSMANIFSFVHDLSYGLPYSLGLLAFLTVHEFGHFFAAVTHRIRATLPYYIPLPPIPFLLSIGTMGAVIRIKERIPDSGALLDTGAAGPLSGFTVSLGLLIYGFLNLPPADYIYSIHPEYLLSGGFPAHPEPGTLYLGKNLLYILLEAIIDPKDLPPMTEMYHYPYLFTGWLGCFVTALNLLPVGQLDGGHVTYAMFGRKGHARTARLIMLCITLLGLPSFISAITELFFPEFALQIPEWILQGSWPGWIIWAIVLSRFVGVRHPPTEHDYPLSKSRTLAGWIAVIIFFLTFTPVPFGLT